MSVAPYPHVEIGVRDDSIYTPVDTETMPLNQPLYMMRTQKGPVGVPVWCDTYTQACRTFGTDTFNKRSKYYSDSAYFLIKTFPSNGAWIMRVASSTAKTSNIVIECGLEKTEVPQWERDENGLFVLELDGSKSPINSNGEVCGHLTSEEAQKVYVRELSSTAVSGRDYYTRVGNYNYTYVEQSTRVEKNVSYFVGSGAPKFADVATTETFDAGTLYFEYSNGSATPKFGMTKADFKPASTKYIKLTGFEGGYVKATKLPEIPLGSTIGDRFVTISQDAIDVTAGDGGTYTGSEASETEYSSYVFTRAIKEDSPYTYTKVQVAAGGDISEETLYYFAGNYTEGQLEPQATIPGYKVAWRARVNYKNTNGEDRAVGDATSSKSDKFTWYPMLDVVADNPGCWGQSFGMKLYFDSNKNTVSMTNLNGSVTYTFAPVELVEDDVTPTPITDAMGQTAITGVFKPNTVDAETEVDLTLKKRIEGSYTGNQTLAATVTPVPENWNTVGKLLMEAEIEARDQVTRLYSDFRTITDAEGDEVAETFVDALYSKLATADDIGDDAGYMCNPLSCVDSEEIPHFASAVIDADDDDIKVDTKINVVEDYSVTPNTDGSRIFVPAASVPVYLGGGEDGPIEDWDIEKYMRAQITAGIGGTQEYLVDYPRCPFNAIYDTGVSLKTKKALLDIMSFRDNVVVNLSTQSTWKRESDGLIPSENPRYDDESIGSSLRAYAWLMREDINNGTEACRAKIFLHAGYTSDRDTMVASTLWIAMKDAQYLNLDHLNLEAKGLPNAAVECYTKLSWRASSEDTKSRCWNAGLNYVQSYGRDTLTGARLHYASVRTVYRYETSVLVDASVVNALCYTKDIIRRSWAQFAGMTMWAAELNQRIKDDLTSRLQYMLNGKYTAEVSVYQTDEDVKLGYVRHVDVTLTSPGTNRVWLATVICKREGYDSTAES